jgi:hypothetical protein
MQFHVTGALPNVQPHFFGVILRRPLSKVGPNFHLLRICSTSFPSQKTSCRYLGTGVSAHVERLQKKGPAKETHPASGGWRRAQAAAGVSLAMRCSLIVAGAVLCAIPAAWASESSANPPPLIPNLGHAVWPIETRSTLAQQYFNQGVRLLYGFNFEQAIDAFRAANTHDGGGCAICFWGEGYAVGAQAQPCSDCAVDATWPDRPCTALLSDLQRLHCAQAATSTPAWRRNASPLPMVCVATIHSHSWRPALPACQLPASW